MECVSPNVTAELVVTTHQHFAEVDQPLLLQAEDVVSKDKALDAILLVNGVQLGKDRLSTALAVDARFVAKLAHTVGTGERTAARSVYGG